MRTTTTNTNQQQPTPTNNNQQQPTTTNNNNQQQQQQRETTIIYTVSIIYIYIYLDINDWFLFWCFLLWLHTVFFQFRRFGQELGIAKLLHRPMGSLSGGEERRVALAAALVDLPQTDPLDFRWVSWTKWRIAMDVPLPFGKRSFLCRKKRMMLFI